MTFRAPQVTDKLRSYGAALREVMPSVEHRAHKGLNNRAENSHQRTCKESSPRVVILAIHMW